MNKVSGVPNPVGVLCDNCKERSWTWEAECSMCHKTKYPTMPDPGPGPDWVCTLCRMGSSRAKSSRERAARQGGVGKRRQRE